MNIGNLESNIHILATISYMDPEFIEVNKIEQFYDHFLYYGLIHEKIVQEERQNILCELIENNLISIFIDERGVNKIRITESVQSVGRSHFPENEEFYLVTLLLTLGNTTINHKFDHYKYLFQVAQLKKLEEACRLFAEHPRNREKILEIGKELEKFYLDSTTVQAWNLVNHVIYSCYSGLNNSYSGLFDCTQENTLELLNILKNKDAEIYQHNPNMWTVLHIASIQEGFIEKIIENFPELIFIINNQTITGLSALHIAAGFNNFHNIEHLVQNGCDVNIRDIIGNTAAHLAAKFGFKYAISFIYSSNTFDKNVLNNAQRTIEESFGENYSDIEVYQGKDFEYSHAACRWTIWDLSLNVLKEGIVSWRYVFNPKILEKLMINELHTLRWWNDAELNVELNAVQELIALLGNMYDNWRFPICYMRYNDMRVTEFVAMLNEDEQHPVLNNFIEQSHNVKFKYFYKVICICIAEINEINRGAFDALCYISYSPKLCIRKNQLLQIFDNDGETLETCLTVLNLFEMITEDGNKIKGLPIVSAIIYEYAKMYELTEDIVQRLVDNPDSTDQEVNEYLQNTEFITWRDL